ncbi:hypothetical protein M501DRAFT_1013067 [Patellaria atrata CBS 101060]|uniref:Malate dehydrogenase n=1 Tax=Patellaria atrata CBS 101060 TaxID=1346257 RepID=A0A9P4VS86_9PEZI|nr:hypothetical protein M501DRAFT_1013067 [Patellaria atrata CBS 101060]
MLFSTSTLLLALSASISAAPSPSRTWNQLLKVRDLQNIQCNVAAASMPPAPTPLPPPSAGLVLSHVVVGRGTQNYTCDLSSPQSTPKAAGAVAVLYNATCIAATYPDLLAYMPRVALQYAIPTAGGSPSSPVDIMTIGHHFFPDANFSVPYFDLNTETHRFGVGALKKLNATAAPEDAPLGPNGEGNGAVPWLKLGMRDAPEGETYRFREVYRINTAGGAAPKTCEGLNADFTVEYAAEYWLYEDA